MSRPANLKVWAALLVSAVSAAIAVTIIGVALDATIAQAATPIRATIEASAKFSVAGTFGSAKRLPYAPAPSGL